MTTDNRETLPAIPEEGRKVQTWKVSRDGLLRAMAILDTESIVNRSTPLLPVEVCKAVISEIEATYFAVGKHGAAVFVVKLFKAYPDIRAHDVKGYQEALAEVFSHYSEAVCEAAVNPHGGVPGKTEYMPKAAELKRALDAAKRRRDVILANAKSHIEERERRNSAPKDEPLTPADIARRKAQVANYLKTRNME